MEEIKKQGVAPFAADANYVVFRNVKDFGAKGDGVTDDSAAIQAAITTGGRCGDGTCPSTSTTPAIVYFPAGTYLLKTPIIQYYLTQFVGDPLNLPVIKAAPDIALTGLVQGVIETDPYIDGGNGAQWYTNQNQFFRGIRNLKIDMTDVPASVSEAKALHWQVSQATHLQNIEIEMATGNDHIGLYMENGSGGFFSDVKISGGGLGMKIGNQQFTIRNLQVDGSATCVSQQWNWEFLYQDTKLSNCNVGFDVIFGSTLEAQAVQQMYLLDSTVSNVKTFVQSSVDLTGVANGSLIIENASFDGVTNAVADTTGKVAFAGPGSGTVDFWVRGPTYTGTTLDSTSNSFSGNGAELPKIVKPSSLLANDGKIFSRARPQYETYSASNFASVRDAGAKGDGSTDDTAAIQAAFDKFAGCKIIYFDAGTYRVSDTITIPEGAIVVGEGWATIQGFGDKFKDETNPHVVVKVGNSGDVGSVEISGMIFNAVGGSAGAVIVEWNLAQSSQGSAALWDSHLRLGGAAGSGLTKAECTKETTSKDCYVAYLALHFTPGSSAYWENAWVWTSDHDIDANDQAQINIFSARGWLTEGEGPFIFSGCASEHHALYQYNFAGASNVWTGLVQTETAYYQPTPAISQFPANSDLHDPTSYPNNGDYGWAVYIQGSNNVFVAGSGNYQFFQHYSQDCLPTSNCQDTIDFVSDDSTSITIYALGTVGTEKSLVIGGQSIIDAATVRNGFSSSTSLWRSSGNTSPDKPTTTTTTGAPASPTTTTTSKAPSTTTTSKAPETTGDACSKLLVSLIRSIPDKVVAATSGGKTVDAGCSCGDAIYSPSAYSCFDGQLCPANTLACGSACYSPDSYGCCNGSLTRESSHSLVQDRQS
ncbi:carbohydrate-binding module family 52 protein [Atractiella rhizophila]|nr:carbohydrate-binding module family 52 protein [Atractiella rhizophila]